VIATLLIAAVFSAPTPPTISEVFTANVQIYISDPTSNSTGSGLWSSDQPAGKSVETYTLSDHSEGHLLRFDLEESFDIMQSGCATHHLDGKMPPTWDWVAKGNYSQQTINGMVYDSWTFTLGYAQLTMAVDSKSNPVWFIRTSPLREVRINFISWTPSVTNSNVFDVPTACHQKPNLHDERVACVARATMLDRAEVWVKARVPYNQGATYGGYREDCSGYVSMTWGSAKPGHTTFTMPSISKEITKADLQVGDVLLCVTEHVVFFGGWADAAKTQYWAYEETRPGEGTVKRETPYPYWYNTGCFIPHRYDSVC
jgi:hypothetical protein